MAEIQPSFFELSVVMAFDHFATENIDIAVIETGLGGRLDSTNVVLPLLSVITNISKDHTDILGESLALLKKRVSSKTKRPLIGIEKAEETQRVFEVAASREVSTLLRRRNVRATIFFSLLHQNSGPRFTWKNQNGYRTRTRLTGIYQQENIRTAIAAYAPTPKSEL